MEKKIFKWVHISDIHFNTSKEGFNTNRLREKLIEHLKEIKDVNVLVLSGDYRFAPTGEKDVKPVANYIKELMGALNLKLPYNELIMVPGNHDLYRDEIRKAVVKAEREEYSPEDGVFDTVRLKYLLGNFSFYNTLTTELGCNNIGNNTNPHALINFEKFRILLLNTAITSCDDMDAGNLLIGSEYLHALFHNTDNNLPTIAIGHHGLEWLNERERNACLKYLEDIGVYTYLCGHSHTLWVSEYGKLKQINVGCLTQKDKSVIAGFSVGELNSDGTLFIDNYKWESDYQAWYKNEPSSKKFINLYENKIIKKESDTKQKVQLTDCPFKLVGLTLLGSLGTEGVKYHWEKNGHTVESIAFNKRLKGDYNEGDIDKVSAYNISVSYGCQLSSFKRECRFCETGGQKYYGNMTAEEIALQCIFMIEYDSNCPSFPHVRNNRREIAFMGQGEPGFNYPSIRQAMIITDKAMEIIDQQISRYIISTCGIGDFLPLLIDDIKHSKFRNRVTLHFSLHAVDHDRDLLMPINQDYNYIDFINRCSELKDLTGEKIGVGVLMFKNYKFSNNATPYTLTDEKLIKILSKLDKNVFKIDLCTLNTPSFGSQDSMSYEEAQHLFDLVANAGYECKIFSSFGENLNSGCGMLGLDKVAKQKIGSTTIEHFNASMELLNKVKQEYKL